MPAPVKPDEYIVHDNNIYTAKSVAIDCRMTLIKIPAGEWLIILMAIYDPPGKSI